jgi:hypothetical protein
MEHLIINESKLHDYAATLAKLQASYSSAGSDSAAKDQLAEQVVNDFKDKTKFARVSCF